MPGRRAAFWLIFLAVAARALTVLMLSSHMVPRSTYEHGEIAANLLAGHGFSVRFLGADGPTSQQAPFYPVLVAAAYAMGGVETPGSLLILQLGQAVLGGLLVAGVLWLASEVAPGRERVRLMAGGIAAFHPTLVYCATHVQVAGLAAVLVTFALASAYRAARTGRGRAAVIAGIWLSLLALTDPILGLSAAGMAWALVMGRGWRGALRPLGLIGLTCALGLLPWTARNFQVHGEFVAVKSTFGYAFWQGNCALSQGTDKVLRPSVDHILDRVSLSDPRGLHATLWAARHEAGYLDDIALTAEDYRELARHSEPERSRILFRRAIADLRAEPWRYARLTWRRLGYFVFFDATNPKTRNVIYRASHLGLTIMAVLGLVLAPGPLRWRLGPTFLTSSLIAGFHALTIVSARFHVPIEPLMGLWASAGLAGRWADRASAATANDVVGVGILRGFHRRRARVAAHR